MSSTEYSQPMTKTSSAARGRLVSRFNFRSGFRSGWCVAVAFAAAVPALCSAASAQQQATPVLLDAMTTELHRAFTSLGKPGPGQPDPDKQLPPYFLSYSVSDASYVGIQAQYGALVNSAPYCA